MKKTLLTFALLASASVFAGPQAPAQKASAAATEQVSVTVTGATTKAGDPLMLSVNGAKATAPSFLQLFSATQSNPTWSVTRVAHFGEKSRLFLASASSKSTLEMDADSRLVTGLKIKKGSAVQTEAQSSGQVAVIKFVSGKTPIGFMVNQASAVSAAK